jgi:hypothetical protein
VGWDIWADNYTRFLTQIDADDTSISLWRIGGPIIPISWIYSRFGRGFEHASGKDAMYYSTTISSVRTMLRLRQSRFM